MSVKQVVMAAAGVGGGANPYIEDVFSTYLYTGNSAGSSSTNVPNGIDLTGEGGLVWIKQRDTGTFSSFGHVLVDTERGNTKVLQSNTTGAEQTITDAVSFNADGFTAGFSGYTNMVDDLYASWTFRKAPSFFDCVTWTGDGVSGRAIPHNLGSTPGCIIIKRTDSSAVWTIFHAGLSGGITGSRILFDTSAATVGSNITAVDDSTFTVISTGVNNSGGTYVAYLFAHNAGGFGDDGLQNVISCGSYVGNGSTTGPVVDLGWEPQWILIKNASTNGFYWLLFDNMRGLTADGKYANLFPDTSGAEYNGGDNRVKLTSSGFQIANLASYINGSGETYIYIAIRRGPMKTPESGTEVFAPVVQGFDGFVNTGFVTDLIFGDQFTGGNNWRWLDRLRGESKTLNSNNTNAEGTEAYWKFDYNTGVLLNAGGTIPNWVWYNFRRAPGFFDEVCYDGLRAINNTTPQAVSHNLGVAPELVIVKCRSAATVLTTDTNWSVCTILNGAYSNRGYLNTTDSFGFSNNLDPSNGGSVSASNITFGYGDARTNASGETYVAYLFASCPGVSKVGSYTGTGTTQTINCGFSSGARFVLIKRTDSTGDWYVWDSARGIVAGNDPYLLLNSTAAEVTATDYIDPVASGFEISSTAPAAINASGGSYIFLAIA